MGVGGVAVLGICMAAFKGDSGLILGLILGPIRAGGGERRGGPVGDFPAWCGAFLTACFHYAPGGLNCTQPGGGIFWPLDSAG